MNIFLIKLSGSVLNNEDILKRIASFENVTVVHGGGERISKMLLRKGIEFSYDNDGIRGIPKEAMNCENIPKIVHKINQEMVTVLNMHSFSNKFGGIVMPVIAEKLAPNNYGGKVKEVIQSHNFKNKVVGFLGTTGKELVDVNADLIAESLGKFGYTNIIYITKSLNSKGNNVKEKIAKTLDIKIMDEKGFLEWSKNV